jgi:hypothetical protein
MCRMMHGRTITAALVLAGAFAAPAWPQALRLEPVDPGVGDRDPLSLSFRTIDVGLHQPMNFEQVFRITGPLGTLGADEEYFARISGGMYAVFPRSVYAPTRQGEVALIPAGTVFYIGPPGDPLAPAGALAAGWQPALGREARPQLEQQTGRLDLRLETRLPGEERIVDVPLDLVPASDVVEPRALPQPAITSDADLAPVHAVPLNAPGTIIGDEAYRRDRLHALMQRALAAGLSDEDEPAP